METYITEYDDILKYDKDIEELESKIASYINKEDIFNVQMQIAMLKQIRQVRLDSLWEQRKLYFKK